MADNYRLLICWLMKNTRINNDCRISNKELIESFLNDNPEWQHKKMKSLPSKIGTILKLIYGYDDVFAIRGGQTYYNIMLLKDE